MASLVREGHPDANASGVSWAAVFAGAAGAAALSLVLLILGFGLGLSAVSPWTNAGASARSIGVSTIAWLAFTQIAASGLGGYLAGRLRTRWQGVERDEVFFRDTAHGFLSWAVASLATAAFLTTSITAVLNEGVQLGGAAVQGAAANPANASSQTFPLNYYVDAALRREGRADVPVNDAARAEVARILSNALRSGDLSGDDKRYAARVISEQTGLTPGNASARLDDTYARARQAWTNAEQGMRESADRARKAAAHSALWMFISLLLGAFFASVAALFGGRQRDA